MRKKVKSSDTEFYFDDCEICKAMKEAEKRGKDLTEDELIASFRRARDKGAIVGGEIFEKEKKLN